MEETRLLVPRLLILISLAWSASCNIYYNDNGGSNSRYEPAAGFDRGDMSMNQRRYPASEFNRDMFDDETRTGLHRKVGIPLRRRQGAAASDESSSFFEMGDQNDDDKFRQAPLESDVSTPSEIGRLDERARARGVQGPTSSPPSFVAAANSDNDVPVGSDVMGARKVKTRNRAIMGGGTHFDVVDYGASGNGLADDSYALQKAWGAACASGQTPTLVMPEGKTYFLKPLTLLGPCKSPITIKILGNLVAPASKNAWKGSKTMDAWIKISTVTDLTVDGAGSGQLDGQGGSWWKTCDNQNCKRPVGILFHDITNLQLRGTRHINSPKGHININNCNGVLVSNLTIVAPDVSPNTDGIIVSDSTHVAILSSTIATGDDCVAIKSGSSFINVSDITCGPGHGISVGSLGSDGRTDTVEEVRVQNCVFHGTDNGARIKTWQGGKGFARRISFSNIRFDAVKNPIIIDQNYCGGSRNCEDKSSGGSMVEVSDITFRNMTGTSASEEAIMLNCGRSRGCNSIVLENINIVPMAARQPVLATCNNVQGRTIKVSPKVPCLKPTFV